MSRGHHAVQLVIIAAILNNCIGGSSNAVASFNGGSNSGCNLGGSGRQQWQAAAVTAELVAAAMRWLVATVAAIAVASWVAAVGSSGKRQ